jgi:hypothetical protein
MKATRIVGLVALALIGVVAYLGMRVQRQKDAPELGASTQQIGGDECLPKGWTVEQMLPAIPSDIEGHFPGILNPTAHVLAWKMEEDNRPWHVENCLLWVSGNNLKGNKRWALARLGRGWSERFKSDRINWDLYFIMDGHAHPFKVFERPPTNRDVYDFLEKAEWKFGTPDWEIIDARVCRKTWMEVIGEAPTKFFPNERKEK